VDELQPVGIATGEQGRGGPKASLDKGLPEASCPRVACVSTRSIAEVDPDEGIEPTMILM